jgi:hypothetical protein
MHSNVDPLSRNPAGCSVTLVKMSDDWEEKIWNGYQDDAYYRRVLKDFRKLQEEGEATKERIQIMRNKRNS